MKTMFIGVIIVAIIIMIVLLAFNFINSMDLQPTSTATNFQECVDEGNPVMESYPRQCRTADGRHFVESIPENRECEMAGGLWGIWSNAMDAGELCNMPTSDAGMKCSDSTECQSFCQAKEGSEAESQDTGMCYGYEHALCMQEVRDGIVQSEWCQ